MEIAMDIRSEEKITPSEGHVQARRADPLLAGRRVLWLQQSAPRPREPAARIEEILRAAGLRLHKVDLFSVSQVDMSTIDLILLDGVENLDGVIETVLSRLRFESQAPLIVLTERHSSDQLVAALMAGADAIWSYETPEELLLVRCKALLRRWSTGQGQARSG